MDIKELGNQIQKYREQAHFSQEALAELIECSPNYISQIERGKKAPRLDKFIKIADALDVSTDLLLGKYRKNHARERLNNLDAQLQKLPLDKQYKLLDLMESAIEIENTYFSRGRTSI